MLFWHLWINFLNMLLLYVCHAVQIWSELASSAKLDYKFHILEMSKVSLLFNYWS